MIRAIAAIQIALFSQNKNNSKISELFLLEVYSVTNKSLLKTHLLGKLLSLIYNLFSSIISNQNMRNKVNVILLLIGILFISAAQNLQENKHPQRRQDQLQHPIVGQEQFNPYPYEVYTPFENDQHQQKNVQQYQEHDSVNNCFLYGLVIGTAIISFILAKKCCSTRNDQRVRARKNMKRLQPQQIQRPIPEGRICYSQPRGIFNTQNQPHCPIPIVQPPNNSYPISALDKEIQFHKKQIEKLQKQKHDIQNQEIKKRQQEQRMIVQKQRQQKIEKDQQLTRQRMMNNQRILSRNVQMQKDYYGYQNYQHPMMRSFSAVHQPEILKRRQPRAESVEYIQIGKKAGEIIQPIPKIDNDSSFASQYPEI